MELTGSEFASPGICCKTVKSFLMPRMIYIDTSAVGSYPYIPVFLQDAENDIITEFGVFAFVVGYQFPFRVVAEKSLPVGDR